MPEGVLLFVNMNEKRKLVIFDWDDTLSDSKTKTIPASALKALHDLHTHPDRLVGVASGRAAFFFKRQNLPWDVLVTNNGQYIEVRGQKVFENTVDPKLIQTFIEVLTPLGGSVLGVNSVQGIRRYLEPTDLTLQSHPSYLQLSDYGEDHPELTTLHILLVGYDPKYDDFMNKRFPDIHLHRYNGYMVDVIPKGLTKLQGIEKAVHALGLTLEDVVAFGDSGNDIDMLKGVGCGVAMGNASTEVKAVADVITTSLQDNGIYEACIKLGLLKETI